MDEFVRSEVFEAKLGAIDDENKRQNERLKKLEDVVEKISEIAASVQLLAQNVATMTKELERQGKRLEAIENEPGEKWKKLTWLIVTAVAGGLVGFLLSQVGM